MKKVVFAVAAVAAGLLALTGCSKKEGASAKSSKAEEKVVLTVWESLQGPDEFIKQDLRKSKALYFKSKNWTTNLLGKWKAGKQRKVL